MRPVYEALSSVYEALSSVYEALSSVYEARSHLWETRSLCMRPVYEDLLQSLKVYYSGSRALGTAGLEAFSYWCTRPSATGVRGLQLLVYEA
jgi:hypothetical protein